MYGLRELKNKSRDNSERGEKWGFFLLFDAAHSDMRRIMSPWKRMAIPSLYSRPQQVVVFDFASSLSQVEVKSLSTESSSE